MKKNPTAFSGFVNKMNKTNLIIFLVSLFMGILYVLNYGVNIPIWDEWNNIDFIRKIYIHDINFSDFFQQLNEHRIFLVRIIIWLEAVIGTYSSMSQMVMSVFIMTIVIYLCLTFVAQKNRNIKFIFLLPIPILLLSTRQYDNMLWAIQLNAIISYLFPVFCFYLLNKVINRNVRLTPTLILLILIGLLCSFSQINGLFVWPVLLLSVFLYKRDVRIILPIAIAGLFSFIIYFWTYIRPSYHPGINSISDLKEFIPYFLNLLGGSIFYKSKHALIFGVFLLLFLLGLFVKLYRDKKVKQELFPLMVIAYCLITMSSISFGRCQFAFETSLLSRYTTISLLFLASIYIIIIDTDLFKSTIRIAIPILLLVLLFLSNYKFIHITQAYKEQRIGCVSVLKNYKTPSELKGICYSEDLVVKQLEFIKNNRPLFILSNK